MSFAVRFGAIHGACSRSPLRWGDANEGEVMRHLKAATAPTHWRRTGAFGALVLASVLGLFIFVTGGSATLPSVPLTFTQSNHVQFTLEGCKNDGTITLPNGNGDFICDDGDYTTGNLGKGWNELDLVPHRLTTSAGSQADATTDYSVLIAADYFNGGTKFGYDV